MHLIEKFAEIRRQVPLRSLTAVGLGIPTCFFRIEPVSIAECFAFCAETTFSFFKMGVTLGCRPDPLGASIQETRIGALSSACGRRARFANAQALLAISAMLNPAQRAHGCNPQTPARDFVPCALSPLRGDAQNETTQSKVIERFLFSIRKNDLT